MTTLESPDQLHQSPELAKPAFMEDLAQYIEVPPESAEFADEIGRLANISLGRIEYLDDSRSRTGDPIFRFSSDSHPRDSFVRHIAMLEVFRKTGVLERYLQVPARGDPNYIELNNSWRLHLNRPESAGKFLVIHATKGAEPKRQTMQSVIYNARP